MPGFHDYAAKSILNYVTGQQSIFSFPPLYLGLFNLMPSIDSGSGTEPTGIGSYARVHIADAQVTNGTTASGNNTLHFAGLPAWVIAGMSVHNITTPGSIPAGTTISSVGGGGTTIVMSANAASTVGNGDTIAVSAFLEASASSGAEPATTPCSVTTGCAITFPTCTADWSAVQGFGLWDSSSGGNLLFYDYLGNYPWLPFTVTSASPGVLTVPGHGYSNGDQVIFSKKVTGTLPSGGSFSSSHTVAGATTDTFDISVNTTSRGDGLVRKILQPYIANTDTPAFAAGAIIIALT